MSNLSVGTITQTGGQTIVTGTSSGLNTEALIENAVQQNNIDADKLDIQIQENDLLIAGYEEFFGLSTNLQTSLEALKLSTSFLDGEGNVFSQRTGDLQSTGASATSLINVSISEDAPTGTYSLVVEQKAEAFSVGSTNVTDETAALGEVGSFTLGLATQTATQIDVVATDSLSDIAQKINDVSGDTGVTASVLKVSETDYQLIIEGSETNVALNAATVSGSVLQNLGIVDALDAYVPAQVIQNEQGSQVVLDGATITRDDNAYDDLITGLTFDVIEADAGSTLTISVDNDVSSAQQAVLDFVDSYNAYREFIIVNQTVGAGGVIPEEAILFSDTILDSLNFAVSSTLSSADGEGLAGSLRDLGIEFDAENRLVVENQSDLDNALLSEFQNVANFFATNITTDDSNLALITNNSTVESLEFTLDITTDVDGNITGASVGGSDVFTIDGFRLVGNAGTVYEGLTLAYAGTTDASINVSFNQGLADLLFNAIEPYTETGGLIDTEISLLNDENDDFTAEAAEIRERGEEIREEQIQIYAAMEAELARLDSLLNTVRALLGNNNDD